LTQEQYGANDRELVNPLANLGTTQYRMGDYKGAEEAYLRSVKIAADTGGNGDRLLLRPLQGLGATYYATRQYEDASVTLQRALDLSRNLDGLLGIGRSYRLEATNGSDEETAQYVDPFAQSSLSGLPEHAGRGLNPDGEKALLLALQTIDKMRPVDHELRGTSLMELGDWYL